MSTARIRFEISDTGEDLDSLPCLFSIDVDGVAFLRIGEGARGYGVPDEDTSYSLFAIYEGVQALVLSLLAEHHEVVDVEDPLSAPLFLADCGAQCCGAHDFSVLHRDRDIVLQRAQSGEEYRVDAATYGGAVLAAVGDFLKFALTDARQRDDEVWSLYDHLGWLVRKVAADGLLTVRPGARAFLEAAESKIQAVTRAQPVSGTH